MKRGGGVGRGGGERVRERIKVSERERGLVHRICSTREGAGGRGWGGGRTREKERKRKRGRLRSQAL